MAFYRRVGDVPPKRHTRHRRQDGGLYYEELGAGGAACEDPGYAWTWSACDTEGQP
jgi:hypothetical protein